MKTDLSEDFTVKRGVSRVNIAILHSLSIALAILALARFPHTMDIIFVDELRVPARVGVYTWEQQAPQLVEINLHIGMPSSRACLSDDLTDTIDYAQVTTQIRQRLLAQHFLLLEALAEHLAHMILHEFGAPWVRVSVAKLGLIAGVKRVGVTIERHQ